MPRETVAASGAKDSTGPGARAGPRGRRVTHRGAGRKRSTTSIGHPRYLPARGARATSASSIPREAFQAPPDAVVAAWVRLGGRWEIGHAVVFVAQLAGFVALVVSVPTAPRSIAAARARRPAAPRVAA